MFCYGEGRRGKFKTRPQKGLQNSVTRTTHFVLSGQDSPSCNHPPSNHTACQTTCFVRQLADDPLAACLNGSIGFTFSSSAMPLRTETGSLRSGQEIPHIRLTAAGCHKLRPPCCRASNIAATLTGKKLPIHTRRISPLIFVP